MEQALKDLITSVIFKEHKLINLLGDRVDASKAVECWKVVIDPKSKPTKEQEKEVDRVMREIFSLIRIKPEGYPDLVNFTDEKGIESIFYKIPCLFRIALISSVWEPSSRRSIGLSLFLFAINMSPPLDNKKETQSREYITA